MIPTSEWTHPDDIGTAEYRAIYELAADIAASTETGCDVAGIVRASLVTLRQTVDDLLREGPDPVRRFGSDVLRILEEHDDWDGNTFDAINTRALARGLARQDTAFFTRTAPYQPGGAK